MFCTCVLPLRSRGTEVASYGNATCCHGNIGEHCDVFGDTTGVYSEILQAPLRRVCVCVCDGLEQKGNSKTTVTIWLVSMEML